MRRVVVPELLDSDAGSPREVEAALGDLRRINRWFGGSATTAGLLRRVAEKAGRKRISVLDVGAGPGEAVLESRKALAQNGIELRISLIDRAATHLPRNGVPLIVGEAMSLPIAANSVDVVTCSLLLHHLEPEGIVTFMDEALRVSRIAVVINDLKRAAAHLALVYAGFPLFRSRLTRHDAVASVRRAYTQEELGEILGRTSSGKVEISGHYLYRVGAIAWKQIHA